MGEDLDSDWGRSRERKELKDSSRLECSPRLEKTKETTKYPRSKKYCSSQLSQMNVIYIALYSMLSWLGFVLFLEKYFNSPNHICSFVSIPYLFLIQFLELMPELIIRSISKQTCFVNIIFRLSIDTYLYYAIKIQKKLVFRAIFSQKGIPSPTNFLED